MENLENEVWKDIEGYESIYQVSDRGRVRSLDRYKVCKDGKVKLLKGKILSTKFNNAGYLQVQLYDKNGVVKHYLLHRLVSLAFIPNSSNKPEVNHIDEDKTNNCIENLEWCSRTYNMNYGTRTERTYKKVNQFTISGVFVATYNSLLDASNINNLSKSCISRVCHGVYKHAGGYIWKYAS